MAAVEMEKLTKKFGALAAVNHLTLRVPEGTVFGFLGPNGAGKTTTLRILLGLAAPTAGAVRILGENIRKSRGYLRRVGFLPDVPVFYNWMTAREYLRFAGELFGLEPTRLGKKIEELLELVGLQKEKKRIGGFSRGMKQRLGLAQALVNDPEVVFLDEPTSALDPIGRKEVLESINAFKDRVTVFFSTHILADVERVCNRAAILNRGELIIEDGITELRQKYGGRTMELEVTGVPEDLCPKLQAASWCERLEVKGNLLQFGVTDGEKAGRSLPPLLAEAGVGIIRLESREPNLEEIFLKLVKKNGSQSFFP